MCPLRGTLHHGDNFDILRRCPTQKSVTLLERIIQAASHRGDVVLHPFCGRGTTTRRARALSRQVDAAEKPGRNWIGIDVKQLAISLIKSRLQDTCGGHLKFVSGNSRRESAQTPSPRRRSEGTHVRCYEQGAQRSRRFGARTRGDVEAG